LECLATRNQSRATGTFVNPNHFAHYAAILLPMSLYLSAYAWHTAAPAGALFGRRFVKLIERRFVPFSCGLLAAMARHHHRIATLALAFLRLHALGFALGSVGCAIRARRAALVGALLFLRAGIATLALAFLLIGVATGLGMAVLGLPYAVVLGVLAGLFELIPMFGPILSAVPAVLVAMFLPFPTVIWVLLFFLVLQQVENNVLAPRISGHAVGLHPLGAMFALLAGFQLVGLLGGLFAVPVAGVVWVLITAGYRNAMAPPPPVRNWALSRWRRPANLPR